VEAVAVLADSEMSDIVITAENIKKIYLMGEVEVHALRGVSLEVKRGEVLAIMGPSGSGKSTLMNIIGALDRPTSGKYYLNGKLVSDLKDDQLAIIRNREVGFVFQTFNLLARHSAVANVELPMRYAGITNGRRKKAIDALEAVGLGNLDTKSGSEILDILLKLNREGGTTLVFVTHDPDIAAQTERIVYLRDGLIVEDEHIKPKVISKEDGS
jgi:putative ABC transport system ATP-binding protein